MIVFSLFIVNAQEIEFTHQQNTILEFEKSCIIEGTDNPCNAFDCNLTIWTPDTNKLIDRGNMTIIDGKDLNYTVNVSNTGTLGVHKYEVFCYNGTRHSFKDGYFEIMTDGFKLLDFDLSNLNNIVLVFILILLWLGLQVIAFYFKNIVFASFGFFIGLIIGFLLSSMGIILLLIFWILNILVYMGQVKMKKQ